MRICNIKIENFKAFEILNFECNSNFNFIVGENNIGKSTLLEVILLWKSSFDKLIQTNGEDFYGANTPCYLEFDKLFFLRLRNDNDIFNKSAKKKLSITISFKHGEDIYPLKITLEKPGNISNSYFRIKYDIDLFNSFKNKEIELGLSLKDAIFVYHTRPIFHSIKNEAFYNNAQLLKKISLGKSHEVIRNKILKSENPDTKFQALQNRLNNVFKSNFKIRFKNKNRQDDEFVRITIQEQNKKEIEISLMGSGMLQIIEIFSTLEFINRKEHCVNILLIDEPDSHIHSNLQANLLDELKTNTNYQTFLISHNDRLINKADEGELFFLNSLTISQGLISSMPKSCYSSVGNELAQNLLSLADIERQKIIIITEGKTDKNILEIAFKKLNNGEESPYHIVSSGLDLDEQKRSGNADTVRRTIEFISTISNNLKLVGLFDNDREGNEQFKGLNKNIFEEYIPNSIIRKHKEKMIFGLLLPVTDEKKEFITDNITQRYFVMEHYFSNDFLNIHNMKGDNILTTNVFEISGNKVQFSNDIDQANPVEFEGFNILFNEIDALFNEVNIPVLELNIN
ncbi:ATP-dependent nuclease [Tenacibaculum finnmarkense]|uniref:AAA family ATPase n=2 Tax=Tenacibaculum finnmarkense TaxID=2781243 RepID=A0AAP1RET3_9FLAO|nr:AAA family ATPase [Tenacibaculum finnmarkense]MBE7652241.1 AAA family ATPase [Tenacibaculum finnmarkense genomovar finnmarkense]MBE7694587.1 AAA family ATPase [Tenacibaculum finnmarkense genomovar finnmarkense]MCD8426775.1 AAA family ATPase [Tenacibaculum finnmarkense genomovar finnmarkense]MCG8730560.1 AAA family ATPase [Tenacibaculum finnmarkense]MCG8750933.1 AAA family ATPase [Tenacibaculum finnmarkense]